MHLTAELQDLLIVHTVQKKFVRMDEFEAFLLGRRLSPNAEYQQQKQATN